MEDSAFHVLLGEGRAVGPYDRRTIVGMRIRQTLTSEHVLIAADGTRLSVGDLIGKPQPEAFDASRSGVFSVVRATYPAGFIDAERGAIRIPKFKDEIEARVQTDVLRLAGRFRKGFQWKEDRVKIPLHHVVHARVRGTLVDLWLQSGAGAKLQRLTLEMFTPNAAGDLVEWLPAATAYPEAPLPAPAHPGHALWIAIAAIIVVVVTVLVVLLWPRVH